MGKDRADQIAAFRKWLVFEYAPRTGRLYASHIERLEAWLRDNDLPRLHRVTRDKVREYAETEIPMTYASRSSFRSALSAYGRYLDRERFMDRAVRIPKRPQMQCRAIDEDELVRVLAAARSLGPREYAAVCLLYYAALRVNEVATLRWSDIEPDGWIHVVGKGLKEARIPLHPALRDALTDLRRVRLDPDVLPGRPSWGRQTHISTATIANWTRLVGATAGLGASLQPHLLRHTALARANDVTGNLRAVQDFGRHSDPAQTAG